MHRKSYHAPARAVSKMSCRVEMLTNKASFFGDRGARASDASVSITRKAGFAASASTASGAKPRQIT